MFLLGQSLLAYYFRGTFICLRKFGNPMVLKENFSVADRKPDLSIVNSALCFWVWSQRFT